MKKVYGSASKAMDGLLFDGMFIAAGGFGLCGLPENLLNAIREAGTCLLYTSPSPRDAHESRMPSSA